MSEINQNYLDDMQKKEHEAIEKVLSKQNASITNQKKETIHNPIDNLFAEKGDVTKYNKAFDKATESLEMILKQMGTKIGWKGGDNTYDFEEFSGFYPVLYQDCAEIRHGDKTVMEFFADENGSLGFRATDPDFEKVYPKGTNPWYPLADIMNGNYCLETNNLDLAREECHNGNAIIYGMKYGNACAFAVDGYDQNLRTKLTEKESNIRFTSLESLTDALENWANKNAKPGYETRIKPELVIYAYDGQEVRSEYDLKMNINPVRQNSWDKDWEDIDRLRSAGKEIRHELEKAAGVPNDFHFKFGKAVAPSTLFRKDALFLTNSFGLPVSADGTSPFITVINGKAALYKEGTENPEFFPDKNMLPSKVYGNLDEAINDVRKICLSEKNISVAKIEYQSYLLSQIHTQENSKSNGIK